MSFKHPSPTGAAFLNKPDVWFSGRWMAVILATSIFASYPEVILGQATFFYRDFGYFGYPLAFHHRESFWRGEVPLWNALSDCGLPFLAQWNTLVLYPGSLFYLLFPLSWSLSVYCLLHQFLAGLGMYRLARRWTGSGLAGAVAGISFAFNGLTMNALMWPNNIAALGWMPLVVLSAERAWQQGGRAIAGGGVIGAIQMLTGAPEIILQTWLIVGVLWLAAWFGCRESVRKLLGRLAGVLLLVAGLSAGQLFPFLDLLAHSQRGSEFADSSWSMPLWGLANLLVPMYNCVTKFFGVYVQFGQYWTSSYYPGIGVLLLAFLAALRLREQRARFLALVTLLALVIALGDQGYLYTVMRKCIPQLGFMRYPIKWVVLAVFCIPLLAAMAVRCATRSPLESRGGLWPDALVLGNLFLVLIAAITWMAWRHPLLNGIWATTWHSALSRGGFLILTLLTLLVLWRVSHVRIRTVAGIVLLALTLLDVLTHMPRQNPVVARAAFEPGLVQLDPKPLPGQSRAMMSPAAEARLHQFASTNAFNDYVVSRLALYINCNLLDGIPKVDGTYSLYLREPIRIEEHLLKASRDPNRELAPLLDLLAVTQITAPGEYYEWTNRPGALPMVTAGQRAVFADQDATFRALADRAFAPAETVYLPADSKPFVSITNRTEATIVARRSEANREEIEVVARQPSLVVIAQAYYHIWRASVDGRPEKIWRANFGYQALQIPAGRHRITLHYRDGPFYYGLMISGLTLAGCVLAWIHLREPKA